MKKVLLSILTILLVFTMSACKKEEPVAGGWTEKNEDITPELQEVIDKALEKRVGVNVVPKKLVGTQVVSGTNYKFLCDVSPVVPNPEVTEKYVTVYCNLNGECEFLGEFEDVK